MNYSKLIKQLSLGLLAFAFNYQSFAFDSIPTDALTFTALAIAHSQEGLSDEPLYTARHHLNFEKKSGSVKYFDGGKQLIAEKTLDFSENLYCPKFNTNLFEHDISYGIINTNNRLIMFLNNKSKQLPNSDELKTKPLICDGGFDYFIKKQVLANPIIQSFHFSLPYNQLSLDMTIAPLSKENVPASIVEIAEYYCQCPNDMRYFIINPKSWLYNLFAEPVILGYQASTAKLVVFSGKSNILDNEGKSMLVNIGYQYLN